MTSTFTNALSNGDAVSLGHPDVATLSFEAALQELEQLVAKLESGQASLEESIALYERGAALKAHCDKRLSEAQMRVDQIVEKPSGLTTQPAQLG